MAECLFRKFVEEREDFIVGSAGLSACKGDMANSHTLKILKRRGIHPAGFSSRPVTTGLLSQATHVFAMTRAHLDLLEEGFPEFAGKYFLVREFAGVPETNESKDIPDPIGMGPAAYDEVASILESAIPRIVSYIESTETP